MSEIDKHYRSADWMRQKYLADGLSFTQIAVMCGVTSSAIQAQAKKLDIPARDGVESHSGKRNGAWIEGEFKLKSQFINDYIHRGMTLRAIAGKYGVSLRTIARWMKIHGISPKTVAEYGGRPKGKDSPLFKHGRGGKPGDCRVCGAHIAARSKLCSRCYATARLGAGNPNYRGIASITTSVRAWSKRCWRPLVLERDRYTCQQCGQKGGGDLHAHHIRSLSSLIEECLRTSRCAIHSETQRILAIEMIIKSEPVRSLDNGVTVCRDCHSVFHTKRIRSTQTRIFGR